MRLEALRRYFDFSNGRPAAACIARAMDLPVDTVESWLSDPDNAQSLDEVVPLWPNLLIVQFPKRLMTSIDAV